MKKYSWLLLFVLCVQALFGQDQITNLLRDQNKDKSSYLRDFVQFGDQLLFSALTDGHGREIWVKEGDEAARLLKDINPGMQSGLQVSFESTAVVLDDAIYFIAADEYSEGEIWKTDGTRSGTIKVTNNLMGRVNKLTVVESDLYFLAEEEDILQVWTSNGTEAGTRMVKDSIPYWNNPSYQGKCKNTFIFTIQVPGTSNSRVWRSDGSEAGTYPITQELDGNGSAPGGTTPLSQYIEFEDKLYFISRRYLHRTDGTVENTEQVTSFHQAFTQLIAYGDVIVASGKLYFSFFEEYSNRLFIYETDGTAVGSSLIYDEWRPEYFMTSNLLPRGDSLFFCGPNPEGGTSLLGLDLTDRTVSTIQKLAADPEEPYQRNDGVCMLQPVNETLVFCAAKNGAFESDGWLSALTTESTRRVEELDNVEKLYPLGGHSYFPRYAQATGSELWRSDPDHASFYLVDNIHTQKFGLDDQPLHVVNARLVFTANDHPYGNSLYSFSRSVGTEDIPTQAWLVYSFSTVQLGDQVLFEALDTIHGNELWRTDGTEKGTYIVEDINEGYTSSMTSEITVHNGFGYFTVYQGDYHYLCRSDGAGVEFIRNLGVNMYGVALTVSEMVSSGEYLYFTTSESGDLLWRSDGTENGTLSINQFRTCEGLINVDGKLFFRAKEQASEDYGLWVATASQPFVRRVKDFGIQPDSQPSMVAGYNGSLVFTAHTDDTGRELWISDGTESGTRQIADINPGAESSVRKVESCLFKNLLYFTAHNGKDGFELWKTDGTAAGTVMVKDIHAGERSSLPSSLVAIGDTLFFQAYDAEHGFELWTSDGTAAGTRLAADIIPGPESSFPSRMTMLDGQLYFMAYTVDSGRQIWKFDPAKSTTTTVSVDPDQLTASVFPNPTTGIFYLPELAGGHQVDIYNTAGRLIRSVEVETEINISDLPAGLYFCKRRVGERCVVDSVIKQ
ncbi:ELWxxDGT repeat protein [Lewinella sp. IMCC34191]|uniref:ELWxxDGT repeat protein n=1 Tax=Lewinella sp. IMCC34191 TaxID=2259172 RepID=UPI0018E53886|nr:ELWxxDGT repeat protein [Lewinella sp. IMCC34191]